jgi:hypothetical protein
MKTWSGAVELVNNGSTVQVKEQSHIDIHGRYVSNHVKVMVHHRQ